MADNGSYNRDTLFDLNFDSNKDFVIQTYSSGTGISNGHEVYIYKENCMCYLNDLTLSSLPNPSFFLSDGILTSFYLTYGAGWGIEYSWNSENWIVAKSFSVENHGNSSIWKIE